MSDGPVRDTEKVDRWVRRRSIEGGWLVWCRLCGKPSKRTFSARMTNYAEAQRASSAFATEHIASPGHAAALDQYFSTAAAEISEGERLLAEIFQETPRTERQVRRSAAREASRKLAREERRRAQREAQEAAPKCAVCGKAVSMKVERADERAELPSGALIHARCVA